MRIEGSDVELNVVVDGPRDGPPVLLLHGWPDSHLLWRHQQQALAQAGFRVVIPDMRGFGTSDKPDDVESYGLPALFADVSAVLDELKIARVHVVGHDWGGILAWTLAAFAADRVDRLVTMSIGHPLGLRRAGLDQFERFWYALLFQFPEPAERWLTANDWANTRAWMPHPEHERIVTELSRPGALRASMEIYRANLGPGAFVDEPIGVPAVSSPTLTVWSSGDRAISEEWARTSADYVRGPFRFHRLDGVGHWSPLEAPDDVNDLLLQFFTT